MKTFNVNSINRVGLVATAFPTVFLLMIAGMFQLPWILSNNYQYIALIAALGIVLLVFIILKKLFTRKYTVDISEKDIVITRPNGYRIETPLNHIARLKLRRTNQSYELTVYTTKTNSIFFKFDVSLAQEKTISFLLKAIMADYNYVAGSESGKMGDSWQIYTNVDAVATNADTISFINTTEKKRKTQHTLLGIGIFAMVMTILIAPFFINPKAFYDRKGDKIFFGNTELPDVDPREAVTLSYHVLKDSSHIYYKDQILEWADRETFQCLREPFYMDKNGLYYETSNFYSKNKIVPLKGEFDAATFRPVSQYGSSFFKDKNHIYEIDVFKTGAPIAKVDIPGIDAETFQRLGNSTFWYADKDRVYFSSDKLKVCNEIDRASFEILTHEVYKDKNNVYFLTYNLKSDNQAKGEHNGYAILEGADAPTFFKLGEKRFVDKNTEWTISNGKESKGKTNTRRREDVN